MGKNTIYLRRKNKVILQSGSKKDISLEHLAPLLKNFEALGYIFSDKLLQIVFTLSVKDLKVFYDQTIKDLKLMVGDNVKHKPMYPNFPKQVMDTSEAELYLNAMLHYFGDWVGTRIMPQYKKKRRAPLKGDIKLKVIDLGTEKDFQSIFTNLVSSNTSISETDKKDVAWFIKTYKQEIINMMPNNVPLRENVALVAGLMLQEEIDVTDFSAKNIKTATDVLRLATFLSGGDISLAVNTKFNNFRRKDRKILLSALENCKAITEDMIRYKERWKRLGERLHPFEYQNRYSKSCKAFNVLFNNEHFDTFNSKVENSILTFNIDETVELLKSRPGEYARRLDNMIRLSYNPKNVIEIFEEIAEKVSTPVLLQVRTHFAERHKNKGVRTFFPKGNVGKIQAIKNTLQRIDPIFCNNIVKICEEALVERFQEMESLGKVYLDEKLSGYHVPFSQRSASKTLKTVARGSRYDLPEGDIVRPFIWWKDGIKRTDLDLSAIFLNVKYETIAQVSYTNLREKIVGSCHSGDITSAPKGASEFVDFSIEKCLEAGVRYVMMSVFSFTQQPYCDLPECFCGVMSRQDGQKGQIYDPKTVDNKMDLSSNTKICIPLIIDVLERKVIWTDLSLKNRPSSRNNLHTNLTNLQLTAHAMVTLKKPNLYDLFRIHTLARGKKLVETIEEADTAFVVSKEGIPVDPKRVVVDCMDTDKIISEYLK